MDVTDDSQKRQEAEERYGWMTVPIIVVGDQCLGGADELYDLERKGKLTDYLSNAVSGKSVPGLRDSAAS